MAWRIKELSYLIRSSERRAKPVFSHMRRVSPSQRSERQRSEVKPIMELEEDSDIRSAEVDKACVAMGTKGKDRVLAELCSELRELQ
ncbi:hypothetical protein AOLI_G00017700 [Acnodon oligacanthus]